MRESGFVQVDDATELYYESAGSGSLNLILVPGWTMSSRVFERQLDHYAESDLVRLIAIDPRAQGRSSKTPDGHHYEQHGCDLYQFIRHLKLDNYVLCGWSFGTLAVLSMLHQFGRSGLQGLIMLDGPPRAAAEDPDRDWATYRYDDSDGQQEFFTLDRLRDPDASNRRFAEWMLEEKTEANIRWVLDITEQMPDSAAALLNATSVFLDYTEELIALDGVVPLLYLMRESQGEAVFRWAALHTPHANVTAFGEHLMFWERSIETNNAVDSFLLECRAAIDSD